MVQHPCEHLDGRQDVVRQLESLRSVRPQDATRQDIERGELSLDALDGQDAFPLWCEIKLLLGSFYLEVPDGDRHENVQRARAHYVEVFQRVQPESDWVAWLAASTGIANAVSSDPIFEAQGFDLVIPLLEKARLVARESGKLADSASIAVTLATALDCDRRGEDSMARREREIALLKEAGETLTREVDPVRWGRVMHNLGAAYLKRERFSRSQNVDLAIKALKAALEVRTAESDPVGRARTLRALALAYPEWGFSDSPAQDMDLANQAAQEANELEQKSAQAAARNEGWARFARLPSAHDKDGEELEHLDGAKLTEWLAIHNEAVRTIPRETMSFEWARWVAGLGVILNVYRRHGHPDAQRDAMQRFQAALDAFPHADGPRLALTIYQQMASMCHEAGDWQGSMFAHSQALELSDSLYLASGSEASARLELVKAKGFAQFGAYAAARLNKLTDAVVLAERSRGRMIADRAVAMEIALSDLPADEKTAIDGVRDSIADLERKIEDCSNNDPLGLAQTMSAKLVDAIGAPPSLLKFRLANPGTDAQGPDSSAEQFAALSRELAAERGKLDALLGSVRNRDSSIRPSKLGASELTEAAHAIGQPILYVLGTIHGAVALAVLPSGQIASMLLDGINSEDAGTMLFGGEGRPGYLASATQGHFEKLSDILPDILARLRDSVLLPISDWLTDKGFERASLVPIGQLGLLPLQAAAIDLPLSISLAPSTRILAAVLPNSRKRAIGAGDLLAVGNPAREGERDLPFAIAEANRVAQLLQCPVSRVLTREKATSDEVHAFAASASVLHFACHGVFRPSDPLESSLLLRGEDVIKLRELYRGSMAFPIACLCVLSACRSASVESAELPDEAIGFPTLLLVAGVPSVVATSWAVDDRACALFCQQFYEVMRPGSSAVDAMRQAQRWLRNATAEVLAEATERLRESLPPDEPSQQALSDFWREMISMPADSPPPFASPYYWAAFAHMGI